MAAQKKKEEGGKISVREFRRAYLNVTVSNENGIPYVQSRFSEKARQEMRASQAAGDVEKNKKTGKDRKPKDFDLAYRQAMYRGPGNEFGMKASCYRNGLISQCRMLGFVMTRAKLGIFVKHDFVDVDEGWPLVEIKGKPAKCEHIVRLPSGSPDIRVRAMWRKWSSRLRIKYDADHYTADDVLNLLIRMGETGGVGEGRHDSHKSAGVGWGEFSVDPATLMIEEPGSDGESRLILPRRFGVKDADEPKKPRRRAAKKAPTKKGGRRAA